MFLLIQRLCCSFVIGTLFLVSFPSRTWSEEPSAKHSENVLTFAEWGAPVFKPQPADRGPGCEIVEEDGRAVCVRERRNTSSQCFPKDSKITEHYSLHYGVPRRVCARISIKIL